MSGASGTLSAPRTAMVGLSLPLIDHIWRVRGAVPIDPALSPEEAFARLDPLLRTPGTVLSADGEALAYDKPNPSAQDKLATFTRGRFAWEAASPEAAEKAAKKDADKAKPVRKLNPVDEFLGAPAPEDPSKKKDEKKDKGRHSPDEGYYLAAFFALVYLAGRWLEPFLVRRRLRAALAGPPAT